MNAAQEKMREETREKAEQLAPRIPERMTAAVLHGREDVRIEQVETPRARRGELILRVDAALTCGTDLKVYRRGYHARMIQPPALFGHEVAGTIVELGEGVREFHPGQRVVALNSAPCGACYFCHRDQENLCADLLFNNGAYAEYIRIPERIVTKNTIRIPEAMAAAHAAMTEPLACALHGWEDSGARERDWVAVVGAGPLGLMMMRLAVLADCRLVAVVKHPEQTKIARELGAHEVIESSAVSNVAAAVRERTPDGRGVDVAIEAVALPETWQQAVEMTRNGGTVNFFGGPAAGTTVSLDTNRLHYGDMTLKATFHHTPAICRRAFALLESGRFHADTMLTGQAALTKLPRVFREWGKQQGQIKTVILPGDADHC